MLAVLRPTWGRAPVSLPTRTCSGRRRSNAGSLTASPVRGFTFSGRGGRVAVGVGVGPAVGVGGTGVGDGWAGAGVDPAGVGVDPAGIPRGGCAPGVEATGVEPAGAGAGGEIKPAPRGVGVG